MSYSKTFKIYSSNIQNSLSPHYYHEERQKYIDIFSNKNYHFKIDKLKKIFYINSSKTSSENINKYIGMANIQSNTGIYIESEEDKGKGNCSIFFKGNVLFGKLRPYLNKVYLAEFDGGCTTEFIVLNSKNSDVISNKFLSIFLLLDCVVNQTKHIMTGNTLPRLQTFDIENLLIPIPPKEIQNKIIDIMDNAYKIKKSNEKRAKELLDSIDDYLLDKLGITLPKEEKVVSFEVNSSNIFGGRIDPFYYKKEFLELESQVEKNVGCLKLKRLTLKVTDGSHHSPKNTMELEKNFVTVKDLTHFGDLDLVNCYKISKDDFNVLARNGCQPLSNDILFSKDGTIGKVYTVTDNNDFVVLSSLAILRPNQELISPKYLEYILSSNIIILFIERLMSGSALRRIILDGIKNLKIPLPPLTIQNEIASHIQSLREESKRLQKEAKEVLRSAKDEVEKIILGDDKIS